MPTCAPDNPLMIKRSARRYAPHHVAVKSRKMGKDAARPSNVSKAASLPIVMTCPFDIVREMYRLWSGEGDSERRPAVSDLADRSVESSTHIHSGIVRDLTNSSPMHRYPRAFRGTLRRSGISQSCWSLPLVADMHPSRAMAKEALSRHSHNSSRPRYKSHSKVIWAIAPQLLSRAASRG
jgi:hypothetical protein